MMRTTATPSKSTQEEEEEDKTFQLRHAWHLQTQTPIESLDTPPSKENEEECRFRVWLVKQSIMAPALGLEFTDAQIRAALDAADWDYVDATMNLLLH